MVTKVNFVGPFAFRERVQGKFRPGDLKVIDGQGSPCTYNIEHSEYRLQCLWVL